MGLDALVYCNCYELGLLREPPPQPQYVRVDEMGSPYFDNPDWQQVRHLDWYDPRYQMVLEKDIEFDNWLAVRACIHENGWLLHHRIGNVSLVAELRGELKAQTEQFPILLEKVLYSGTHTGDFLTMQIVVQLEKELEQLSIFQCADPDMQTFMHNFHQQMVELRQAALSVGHPICF